MAKSPEAAQQLVANVRNPNVRGDDWPRAQREHGIQHAGIREGEPEQHAAEKVRPCSAYASIVPHAFAYAGIVLHTFAYASIVLHAFAYASIVLHAFAYASLVLHALRLAQTAAPSESSPHLAESEQTHSVTSESTCSSESIGAQSYGSCASAMSVESHTGQMLRRAGMVVFYLYLCPNPCPISGVYVCVCVCVCAKNVDYCVGSRSRFGVDSAVALTYA